MWSATMLNKMKSGFYVVAAVLVIGIVLFAPWGRQDQSGQQMPATETSEIGQGIALEIVGEATLSYELPCDSGTCDLTAFSALQKLASQDTIGMQYKTYEGLGVFITEIAGIPNGQDGKFWVYEINGQRVPVAADVATLSPGDRLTWKFVIPE